MLWEVNMSTEMGDSCINIIITVCLITLAEVATMYNLAQNIFFSFLLIQTGLKPTTSGLGGCGVDYWVSAATKCV